MAEMDQPTSYEKLTEQRADIIKLAKDVLPALEELNKKINQFYESMRWHFDGSDEQYEKLSDGIIREYENSAISNYEEFPTILFLRGLLQSSQDKEDAEKIGGGE